MSSRIDWIDIAKGISIIIVVLGHSRIARLPYYGDWQAAWTMPFFIFISGLVFGLKPNHRFGYYLKRRINTLIRPFILFSIVVLSLSFVISDTSPSHILNDRLTNGWGGYALWFIPVLFITELLFCVIHSYIRNSYCIALLIGIISIIGYFTFLFNLPNYWNICFCLTAILFYYLGFISCRTLMFISESSSTKRIGLITFVLFIFSAVSVFNQLRPGYAANNLGGGGVFTYITAICGTVFICCLSIIISRLQSKNSIICYLTIPTVNILKYLGKITFVILAFHQIILMTCAHFQLFSTGIIETIFMWICVVAIAEIIDLYLPWILGRRMH